MDWIVGIDIGGTCTDCVVLNSDGDVITAKAFSTPWDFSQGVLDALSVAADELNVGTSALLRETKLFLHATTVAENAVIEGDLAKGGILTTRGFEDTLILMRGGYAEWSGRSEDEIKNVPYVAKPTPLVTPELIRGIGERTDAHGEILLKPQADELETSVEYLVSLGVDAIGVSFLWAFANPENEIAAYNAIKAMYPNMFVTLSHEVAPVMGEFERSQTVALNIRLGPTVGKYLDHLKLRLKGSGYEGPLLVMQAYGGLLVVDRARHRPVGMIESGPASGLVGSRALGQVLGYPNIIGADMGGTTFKAGVINEGFIDFAREPMVGAYHYSSPKMNMESIGVAGGSLVRIDSETGTPHIGPKSAGSDPGPVCYDRGGVEPTVTDVDLILGYLHPRYFLGGREPLNIDAARRAFKLHVADHLEMEIDVAAGEVYRLANSMIYDMLHRLTVERGLDPREYVLFSTGGTAGMHVSMFAPELKVQRVVIPNAASVHGAFGVVTSDVSYQEQISRPLRVPADVDEVNALFDGLEGAIRVRLREDGFSEDDVSVARAIEMRYRRQVHVVTVPLEEGSRLTAQDLARAVGRFNDLYEERFGEGSGYREAGIEMVNFRVQGVGHVQKPILKASSLGKQNPADAFIENAPAYFGSIRQYMTARCYEFERLTPGNIVEGPAIIWGAQTTIVINPDQIAKCDAYRNLELTW